MNPVHRLYPHVTWAMLAAELAREHRHRRRFYPALVDRLEMTPADRDHQLALAAAWEEDCARMADPAVLSAHAAKDPPRHGMTWADRTAGLERELQFRERVYTRLVQSLELEQAEADRRIACLAAMLAVYHDGWDWIASNGEAPRFALLTATPAIAQARREWDDHMARLAARRSPATQEALL